MLWWRQAIDALFNGAPDPVRLPPSDSWVTEERADVRAAAAMSLLDEDVCGFFLLTFHRDSGSQHISVSHVVERDWWPPIAAAVAQVRNDGV